MDFDELLERLGAEIAPELLQLALTHSSYAYEQSCQSNERLEFLGDSILGNLVALYVFMRHPDLNEGELTKLKNAVVSAQALATAAMRLELGDYLRLGKGERQTGGQQKINVLADAFEAVLGAAFLTGGTPAAEQIVARHIFPLLDNPDAIREAADPKTSLLERLAKLQMAPARYEVEGQGPDHDRVYRAGCFSGDSLIGTGQGLTKRSAETQAAIAALKELNQS